MFSRAGETGPPQLYAMPVLGGEPRKLTDHKLGASAVVFAPDGDRIAYLAPVPEPGRYGTDEKVKPEGEEPRRIDRMSYRVDGKGFLLDKPEQLFVLDLTPGAKPRQITAEPGGAGRGSFTPDGRRLVYARETGPDELTSEIAAVDADADHAIGELLAATAGDAADPVVAGDLVLYTGAEYTGHDFAGRSNGLWAVPLAGGTPRRLTDAATVNLDPGEPVVLGDAALILVQNRGAVQLCSVPLAAENRPLAELSTVLGGKRVVKGFSVFRTFLAATVADPQTPGEVFRVDLRGDGDEVQLTDLAGDLRAAGIRDLVELDTTAPDGYPVHGWLVLPEGDGPHPVLLNVHGGPHAQYGWGLFDEAQVYAAAGYAVVMGNPRGSSGYGQDHGRAIVGAMGTVDVDDVLALLDSALSRDDLAVDRVGVMGGSYGGFMTSWLAGHTGKKFVAGISERAVNAWDSFSGASDIGYFFAEGYVGTDRAVQWDRSPLAHADDIEIPLLIVHSEHDWRCPLEQGSACSWRCAPGAPTPRCCCSRPRVTSCPDPDGPSTGCSGSRRSSTGGVQHLPV